MLRNVGIMAPGPILSYYDWPSRYPDGPFIHQRETSEFSTLHPRCYVLNDMGTGKTLSGLWAFDYLRSLGVANIKAALGVKKLVVISPLSTLERAWADEVFKNFPDLNVGVAHGETARRVKIIRGDFDVIVINHDGLKNSKVLAELVALGDEVLVIIDELAVFRNASTDRWKALNVFVNGNKKLKIPPKTWVWGMTGTPIPTEPTDAWAQCRLITPGAVPGYFGAFRDQVMRQVSQYKWAPRDNALEVVHRAMQPAIRFSREECIDLPPTTYVTREVPLTPEQERMYKQMVTQFKTEYEGGQIKALNEAVKLGKLLQIVCGVAYGPDGNMTIPAKPRTDAVIEVIEQASAKVIVFVPLTGALDALAMAIAEHYRVEVIHGGVSKPERDRIFGAFQSPHGARVIVAQPGTMAHGLTLTEADTIVWFAPINSSEIYQQANARIVRPGQKRNTLIVRIEGSPMERAMYARLDRREGTQGLLLDLFS